MIRLERDFICPDEHVTKNTVNLGYGLEIISIMCQHTRKGYETTRAPDALVVPPSCGKTAKRVEHETGCTCDDCYSDRQGGYVDAP